MVESDRILNTCEKYIWTNTMLTGMIDMLDCAFTNMKYSWGLLLWIE